MDKVRFRSEHSKSNGEVTPGRRVEGADLVARPQRPLVGLFGRFGRFKPAHFLLQCVHQHSQSRRPAADPGCPGRPMGIPIGDESCYKISNTGGTPLLIQLKREELDNLSIITNYTGDHFHFYLKGTGFNRCINFYGRCSY